MMEGEGGVVVRGRVEIDMRQPFRSVKEAVTLFGEKVLVGEVYGNKLKEMQSKANNGEKQPSKLGAVTAELEETKQNLEKTKEQGYFMAHCLDSLREELEHTKRELYQLKAARETTQPVDLDQPEIEELKFVENTTKGVEAIDQELYGVEFEKKRSVKFASPLLTKMIVTSFDDEENLKNSPQKKMKKKPLVPFVGKLFLMMKKKKKGSKERES